LSKGAVTTATWQPCSAPNQGERGRKVVEKILVKNSSKWMLFLFKKPCNGESYMEKNQKYVLLFFARKGRIFFHAWPEGSWQH
jgi:hypothetical protein